MFPWTEHRPWPSSAIGYNNVARNEYSTNSTHLQAVYQRWSFAYHNARKSLPARCLRAAYAVPPMRRQGRFIRASRLKESHQSVNSQNPKMATKGTTPADPAKQNATACCCTPDLGRERRSPLAGMHADQANESEDDDENLRLIRSHNSTGKRLRMDF